MKILVYYIITLFGCISFLSCTKEKENPTETFSDYKLKRKLFYENLNDSIPKKILDFQYNNDNILENIYHFSGDNSSEYYKYESFAYKDKKLSNKYTYNYDSEFLVWRIYDSTKYSYQDDKLFFEEIFYFTSSFDTILYKYFYSNTNIIEKRKYYNQEFKSLTKYDYLGDLCVQESIFSDSLMNNRLEYIVHTYDKNARTKSEKFLNNNSKIQIITYSYDNDGRLIIEQSEQTDYTVTIQLVYLIKYEYY
jgi:hypothetical protein